ncbi:hypothetical protein GEMRC1_012017 [Eukaryota sp. GEM-RC1]
MTDNQEMNEVKEPIVQEATEQQSHEVTVDVENNTVEATTHKAADEEPPSSWLANYHLPIVAICMGSGGAGLALKKDRPNYRLVASPSS